MITFTLSQRERNTELLCSNCVHMADGECTHLVRIREPEGDTFVRLARLSVSGGECQMFRERMIYAGYSNISEEDRKHIEELMKDQPFPISFGQMARWYFGHVGGPIIESKEEKE